MNGARFGTYQSLQVRRQPDAAHALDDKTEWHHLRDMRQVREHRGTSSEQQHLSLSRVAYGGRVC